jgi:hypothetical protein
MPASQVFSITVKPFVEKPKAAFFSLQSFLDSIVNGLVIVGFVVEAAKVDYEFQLRMELEVVLASKVEAAKKAKKAN